MSDYIVPVSLSSCTAGFYLYQLDTALVWSHRHIYTITYDVTDQILHGKNEISIRMSLLTGVFFAQLTNVLEMLVGWDDVKFEAL